MPKLRARPFGPVLAHARACVRETQGGFGMRYIIIGNQGSDAGYWVFDGHGLHHVGGWGVDQLREVGAALNIMRESTRLKTPGLAEAAAKVVAEFVEKQLSTHVKEADTQGVVILA